MTAVKARLRSDLDLRQILARIALALCMVLAQYGAVVHELSHAVEPLGQHDNSSLPHDELCIKCLAFGAIGHSMTGTVLLFMPASYGFAVPTSAIRQGRIALTRLAYQSRAPPSYS